MLDVLAPASNCPHCTAPRVACQARSRSRCFLFVKPGNSLLLHATRRYFNFMQSHLSQHCNYELPAELREELETAVVNLEVR